ncbi:MAG TPA: type II secretion system F family protein [Acidimicrobiia bacterium]
MLAALIGALGVLGPVPLAVGLTVSLIWLDPILATPVVMVAVLRARSNRNRQTRHDLVAGFLRTVAAELRAGRSLRAAISGAVESVDALGLAAVGRLARAGRPLAEVASELSAHEGLGLAATAVRVAARTGGSIVDVFEMLINEAVEDADLERERRTLTVQARLSIGLVGGFPLLVLVVQVLSGETGRLLARGPVGMGILAAGSALLLAGLIAVGVMLRRARR